MISLVTQSDGSARRVPFVSLGLAIAMVLTFSSLREQSASVQAGVDTAIAEAVAYLEEQPSLVIADELRRYIPAERAKALSEKQAREGTGLDATWRSPLKRRQAKLDGLVANALAQIEKLPAHSFAVTGQDDAPARNFDHVFHHASLAALGLSLFALLFYGMALEDAWGSIVFGAFCAAMVPTGAFLYNAFPPLLAQPWLGGAGLSVALLGATASRWPSSGSPRLLGGLPLVPWLMIPAWFAADTLLVRELTFERLDLAPTVVYGGLFAAGLVLGGLIRQLGFEEKLTDRWDDSNVSVNDPTYEKAMDLRVDGKREEAMKLLVAAFAQKASLELAFGLWDVSKELERPEEGAVGALHLVRDALRRNDQEAAASYWCEIVDVLETVDAEPLLFVKIAEVFDAAKKPVEAVCALDCSTRAPRPLPPELALRAATLAAEHDTEVASRIAKRAVLAGAGSKEELAALQEFLVKPSASSETISADEMLVDKRTPGGEPLVVKRREIKALKGLHAKPSDPVSSSQRAAQPEIPPSGEEDFSEAGAVYEDLDPEALDLTVLGAGEGFEAAMGESMAGGGSEVDRWNSPGLATDLSEPLADEEYGAVDLGALDTETTEATHPDLLGGSSDEYLAASIEDPVPILDVPTPSELRTIHIIEAVPLALEDVSIKVDVDDKGKTRLPFQRIDAIAVAAVRGLRDRPVVVVDLVLNLSSDRSDPLRVLRIRSDRFDPRSIVEEAANGVEALQRFVGNIVAGSQADLLPSEGAVSGDPFAMFDSLADYQSEVLQAQRSSGSRGLEHPR